MIHEEDQFKDLLLYLRPLHRTRVLLISQGKIKRGSGFDDMLVDSRVFWSGVSESALNESHHVGICLPEYL